MSIVDITDHCNLNCTYCCRGKRKTIDVEPDNKLLINVVEQIVHLRGTFVVLQGGEPLLKDSIGSLLIEMKKLKSVYPGRFLSLVKQLMASRLVGKRLMQAYMRCLIAQQLPLYCITTNGMIYSDSIESALFNGGFYVEVSLDGPTSKINEKTRFGIDFDTVVGNIRKYVQRLPVEISCTITESNVDSLSEMLSFAHRLGCVCLKLSPVIMIGRRDKPDSLWTERYLDAINDIIDSRSNELHNILLKIKIYSSYLKTKTGSYLHEKLSKAENVLLETHECSAFQKVKDIYVDTQMNVYGCASMKNERSLVMGNLKEMSLRDIWNSNAREALKKEFLHNGLLQLNSSCICKAATYSRNKNRIEGNL